MYARSIFYLYYNIILFSTNSNSKCKATCRELTLKRFLPCGKGVKSEYGLDSLVSADRSPLVMLMIMHTHNLLTLWILAWTILLQDSYTRLASYPREPGYEASTTLPRQNATYVCRDCSVRRLILSCPKMTKSEICPRRCSQNSGAQFKLW